jgi:hypothetical protein
MPIIPAPGRLRLEDLEFKDLLGYIMIPSLKTTTRDNQEFNN